MEFDVLMCGFAIFLVAILYSSVGHGGASGYIAVLTLWGLGALSIKIHAPLFNVFVSAIAFYHYIKVVDFNYKFFGVLMLSSLPFAYVGASMEIDVHFYKRILGGFLCIAGGGLTGGISFRFPYKMDKNTGYYWVFVTIVGVCIGFLSGLPEVGGGIFLSPIMIAVGWSSLFNIAAVSALFILETA